MLYFIDLKLTNHSFPNQSTPDLRGPILHPSCTIHQTWCSFPAQVSLSCSDFQGDVAIWHKLVYAYYIYCHVFVAVLFRWFWTTRNWCLPDFYLMCKYWGHLLTAFSNVFDSFRNQMLIYFNLSKKKVLEYGKIGFFTELTLKNLQSCRSAI